MKPEKNGKQMSGITIRLPDQLRDEIKRRAKKEGRSFGQFVRVVLERAMARSAA